MTTKSYSQVVAEVEDTIQKGQVFTDLELDTLYDTIDALQATDKEKEALQDLTYYIHTSKDTGEYESFNQGILIGGFDKDLNELEYFRKLDRDEMRGDMFAFEDENKAHDLFAQNPWNSRGTDLDSVSKKSEATMDVVITHRGDNYITATSDYGKVYIPKACNTPEDTDTIKVRSRFQGFDGCRNSAMPWRALVVV